MFPQKQNIFYKKQIIHEIKMMKNIFLYTTLFITAAGSTCIGADKDDNNSVPSHQNQLSQTQKHQIISGIQNSLLSEKISHLTGNTESAASSDTTKTTPRRSPRVQVLPTSSDEQTLPLSHRKNIPSASPQSQKNLAILKNLSSSSKLSKVLDLPSKRGGVNFEESSLRPLLSTIPEETQESPETPQEK